MVTDPDTPILLKTKELCETIVAQPQFQSIQQQVQAFLADPQAQNQYRSVVEKGESLQKKQQRGVPLSDEDVTDFEKNREVLIKNPVVKGFLEAQEQMHQVQQAVQNYVMKTFELGRTPAPEDISCGCDSGCGCH